MAQDNNTTPTFATVYIPTDENELHNIVPGSGIVGAPLGTKTVCLYYEGNIYDASNLRHYEERVRCAASRLFTHYPTVACLLRPREDVGRDLIAVGQIDNTYRITYRSPALKERVLTYGALWRPRL